MGEDKTTVEVAKAEANNIRATAEHNVKVMKRLGSMEASQGKILAGVEEMKKVVLKDEALTGATGTEQEPESEDEDEDEDDDEEEEEDKEEEKDEEKEVKDYDDD